MRRSKQQLPDIEAKEILRTATNGVLSLVDSDGKPYGVPMSFIYDGEDAVYFHCALSGRKIDCIKNNPNACFTIVSQDDIHPERFTTYFRSVIATGTVHILEDRGEMMESLRMLSAKYAPSIDCEPEIEKGINRVLILKFVIKSLTGKEAVELTKANH